MNLHLNDLSYLPNATVTDNLKLLLDFLDVCERTEIYSIEKIIVPYYYSKKDFVKKLSFESCFYNIENTGNGEEKLHTRIKSLLANRFQVINDIANEALFWIEWNGNESEFLKRGLINNTPVISFKSHNEFEQSQFNVAKVVLDENAEKVSSTMTICNISEVNHFSFHNDVMANIQLHIKQLNGKWDPLKEPLRFVDRIKEYLKTNNYKFDLKEYSGNERISLANNVGREIAKMNGWQYHGDFSKKNRRSVFKSRNSSVYLAIDTETVSFELHNRSGDHQGEYNFLGEKIEEAKGHKLIVK